MAALLSKEEKRLFFFMKIASALISDEVRTRGQQCNTLKTDVIQFLEPASAQGEELVL